ncbi:MAG TPA: LamG domain-containing protein, partial [Phormidium sp.]
TVETKFAYPFSVEQEWQVLTSFPSELEIVVHNRTALGIRFQGEFVNCGYDLTTLSAGWHNLSIVSQAQENLIIHFYIDGEEIGELSPPETPTSKALEFNNHSDDSEYQEDYVDLPSIDWDFSENGFTLEAWVYFENYTDKSTDDECNIIVLKDEEDNLIGLVIYDDGVNNNNLSFRVYTADNNSELIVPKCLELQKWLHLAVVINTEGKTCVYKNGTLIYYEEDFSIPSSVDRPFSYIGDNDLNAQISEVRLWTVVRSQEEIQQNMNKILKGDEPGLVNYWRLKDNSVRDYTANKQNGTVIGTPATVNNTSLKITTIANGSNGEEQFGKLAEFRVWNKALSSSEITANLAKKQLNGNEPNLLTYYTFNEGTGAQIYDRTGNGYDGSLQGETWEKVLTAIEPSQNYRKAEPEQWLLNSVRPICLNFNKDNSLIRLLKPIDM